MESVKCWCLLMVTCLMNTCTSYPNGTPDTPHVCKEMFPEGHHVDAQPDKPPYAIDISSNMYSQSMAEIRVTIRATGGYFIRGLFVQVRRANCSHPGHKDGLGVFQLLPGETFLKTLPCNGHQDSALTHRSNSTATSTTFKWFTPATTEGHLYFVATIVKEMDIFWTGVTSEILRQSGIGANWQKCPIQKLIDPPFINTTPRPTTPAPKITTTSSGAKLKGDASRVHVQCLVLLNSLLLAFCSLQLR